MYRVKLCEEVLHLKRDQTEGEEVVDKVDRRNGKDDERDVRDVPVVRRLERCSERARANAAYYRRLHVHQLPLPGSVSFAQPPPAPQHRLDGAAFSAYLLALRLGLRAQTDAELPRLGRPIARRTFNRTRGRSGLDPIRKTRAEMKAIIFTRTLALRRLTHSIPV